MSVPYAQSPALAAFTGIRHGFFGRLGGSSTGVFSFLNVSETGGDVLAVVAGNRALALAELGFSPEALATLTQTHSTRVLTLDSATDPNARPDADAMVTNRPGLMLGILTADCAPILLADPQAGVIGAAHAGWKGAIGGIVAHTVEAMTALGAQPSRIVAAIGPTISMPNYEVGPDFAAELLARHDGAANRLGTPAGGREHFDLPGFAADQLRAAGVGLVDDLGLCTYAAPQRFFSHRRATHEGAKTGRQISMIGLV